SVWEELNGPPARTAVDIVVGHRDRSALQAVVPVLDVLDVPGAIVLKGRAGTEASGYRMVIVPSRGTSAAIVGSIDPDGEVVVGAVTRGIVGNTAHVTVWAFDDDRNLVQE